MTTWSLWLFFVHFWQFREIPGSSWIPQIPLSNITCQMCVCTLWSGGAALWVLMSVHVPQPLWRSISIHGGSRLCHFLVPPLVRRASRGKSDSSSSLSTGQPLLFYSMQVSGHFNVSAIDHNYYCSPSIWMQMRLTPSVERRREECVCANRGCLTHSSPPLKCIIDRISLY